MLDVMNIGKEHEAATGNEAAMESNIVHAMGRYFDRRKTGPHLKY